MEAKYKIGDYVAIRYDNLRRMSLPTKVLDVALGSDGYYYKLSHGLLFESSRLVGIFGYEEVEGNV